MQSILNRYSTPSERKFLLLLFALLYVYLWMRAIWVPVIHDEIASFYHYIQTGRFLPYSSEWDANNHFLNSALTWLSYSTFGLSTWSLRLPNLLIAPLFFVAVYKIAKEIPNTWIRIMWIVTVCFNHFFIEFSALARGYGMSMAFIMAAVWLTIKVFNDNKISSYFGLGLMCLFALLSNLILIYSVLILLVLLFVNAIIQNHENIKGFFYRTGLLTLFGVIPAFWAISYLFELKSKELLYYGIEGSFWHVTVETLVFNSIGGESQLAAAFVIFMLLIVLLAFFVMLLKAKSLSNILSAEFVFILLLFGNIGLFIFQHFFLGLKYPEDRIGMFLIPYFLGSFYFALSRLRYHFNKIHFRYLVIPLFFIPISFVSSLNLTHVTYWETMGVSDRFYNVISATTPKESTPPVVGGFRHSRALFWAYNNYLDGGRQNLIHRTDTLETTDDYLIFNVNDCSTWNDLYDLIDYDELRDIHLLQRKTKAPRRILAMNPDVETNDTINETYFLFMSGSLDTLSGKDLFFSWDMSLYSPGDPFRGAVVLDFRDQNQNSIYYHTYKLFRQRKTWDGSLHNAINGIKYSGIPSNAKSYSLYLWNVEGQKYSIREGKMTLTEFVKENH